MGVSDGAALQRKLEVRDAFASELRLDDSFVQAELEQMRKKHTEADMKSARTIHDVRSLLF